MKRFQKSLVLVGLTAVTGVAAAQNPLDIGANVGVYLPTNREIRDAFGSQILRFGFGSVGKASTGNLKIGTEFDFISANKNGNRMLIVPFMFGAEQALTFDQGATTKPYVKALAGVAYMDYSVNVPGGRRDSKVVRITYGAEFGIVVSDHLRLAARYNVFPKTSGLDFSGLSLSATFSLR